MSDQFKLTATKRTNIGHKARLSRRENVIPATMYGNGTPSVSLGLNADEFAPVFKKAGETHLIELSVEGKTLPVLIHAVGYHPVKNSILNVEFLTVNLKEKLKTSVPVKLIGESPAVAQKTGNLLTLLNQIDLESFPADIPETIEIDVSSLVEVGNEIKVKDIKTSASVTILSDPELPIVRIGELIVEKEVVQVPTATAEVPVVGEKSEDATPATEKSATDTSKE